jgi:hypothetical protein
MAALMQQARTCIGTASQPPCRLGVLPVAWCRVARSSSSRSSSRRQQHLPHAAPGDGSSSTSGSSEFEGVPGGDEGVQDALLAQLRVQLEAESLKQEIKEDLQGKVEQMKAIGEDVSGSSRTHGLCARVVCCASPRCSLTTRLLHPSTASTTTTVDQPAGR